MENSDTDIISEKLLNILVCPMCKTQIDLIEYKKGNHGLKCSKCNNIYPVRDGIPVMLPDEAIKG